MFIVFIMYSTQIKMQCSLIAKMSSKLTKKTEDEKNTHSRFGSRWWNFIELNAKNNQWKPLLWVFNKKRRTRKNNNYTSIRHSTFIKLLRIRNKWKIKKNGKNAVHVNLYAKICLLSRVVVVVVVVGFFFSFCVICH